MFGKQLRIRKLDFFIYILILLLFAYFLLGLDYSGANPVVLLTMFVNGILFCYKIMQCDQTVTLRRNLYIFNLIFFFFAPLQQYLSDTVLWRYNGMTLIYHDEDYLMANILIFISSLAFELGYHMGGRKKSRQTIRRQLPVQDSYYEMKTGQKQVRKALFILTAFSVLSSIIIIATNGLSLIASNSALILQIKHMIMFVPVIALLISMSIRRTGYKKAKGYTIFFTLNCIVLFLGFSDTMARFIMLGAVMSIVSYYMCDSENKALYFLIYVTGFFFLFSMMRYVNILEVNILHFVDFRQNDYDAYQILMMVMRYVREEGICWGQNLLSALVCIVPRSIAPWRLEATGAIAISHYGSWFTNVSTPLVAEMYFAFGSVGVIVLSVGVGLGFRKLNNYMSNPNSLKQCLFAVLSGLSIYIFRGSLLATYSYTFGILLALWGTYRLAYNKVRIKQ